LISQATQATLVIFFTRHDPARLAEVESLMKKFKGAELDLAKELAEKYKLTSSDSEFSAFEGRAKELKSLYIQGTADEIISDVNRIDPLVLQDLAQEARKKYEAQLEEELGLARKRFDGQLDEERSNYRSAISEKEGLIVKLQTEVETLTREKSSREVS
jgi:hypothetical protein